MTTPPHLVDDIVKISHSNPIKKKGKMLIISGKCYTFVAL